MKNRIIIPLIIISIIILSIALYLSFNHNQNSNFDENKVVRVIDGDTFEIASGEVIRMICINAVEKNEKGYNEAADFLSELILYKSVILEKDKTNKDAYGRLLRYVYINDTFVNKEMVQRGYAKVFRYGEDLSKCDEIEN